MLHLNGKSKRCLLLSLELPLLKHEKQVVRALHARLLGILWFSDNFQPHYAFFQGHFPAFFAW